jgi:hypothetical protein
MARIRLIVSTTQAGADAVLATVDPAWTVVDDASGQFERLNYTRVDAALGDPDSFTVTDADNAIFVYTLTR